jgi:CBS domain containing-hemolysin-like protein
MLKLFPAVALLIISALAFAINKAYEEVPAVEIKRRARVNDKAAHRLYKAVVYEKELSIVLLTIAILTAAGGLVLLTRGLNPWVCFVLFVIIIRFGISWLPYLNIPPANYLAVFLAPAMAWVIERIHPVTIRLARLLDRHSLKPTKLYQIDDLLELLNKQVNEADNRIPKERLAMAAHALTFGDVLVKDIMIPRREIVSVNSHDTVGPVLMGELHESGHSRFPVYDGKEDNIVGTLFVKDLVEASHGGKVSSLMKKEVYYAHEDQTLEKLLHAFLKAKHHMFIVVDKFEEVVGVITIEDVLEEIIGSEIVDEFDKYDDLRAVAGSLAKKEHTEKTTEVIE